LNQILLNAVKYRRGDQVELRIFAAERQSSVELVIEDNGIGIQEHELDRIFDKGFTGSNGRRYEREQGSTFEQATGMGLYLCKKLCDQMGITIYAESKVGEGTKIIMCFPKSSFLPKLTKL
jgi:signal transduction histidine kinase